MKGINMILLGAIFLYSISCNEKALESVIDPNIEFSGYSTTCLHNGKISKITDSFTYNFSDSLIIDYLMLRGCNSGYPFKPGYSLFNDTLTLIIRDTIPNPDNVNCICNYNIHFSFLNLPKDHYYLNLISSWIKGTYHNDISDTVNFGTFTFTTITNTKYLGEIYRNTKKP